MEWLDVYNARGEPLGVTKPREIVHRDGDWHKTFHCWVIYTDANGEERIVFQQRGPQVEHWPGKFDITAAGHYQAHEGREGGIREIYEEIGIVTTLEQLIYAGVRLCVDEFQPGFIDHELQDVHFLIDQRDVMTYIPQVSEVHGFAAVPIPRLLQLFAEEIDQLIAPGAILHNDDQREQRLRSHEFVITRADLIPSIDRYYHRAAIAAQRILHGEQYIWI